MGKINKNANLYDRRGRMVSMAPLRSVYKQLPPEPHKYPGSCRPRV